MTSASNGRFEIAAPDCVAEDFDGEVVVVNLNTGRYFSIRGLGSAVWHDLLDGHAIADIAAVLVSHNSALGEPVQQFIDSLLENQLLRPLAAPADAPTAFRSVAALGEGNTTLIVESYDDMKDLLLTDPIHEVDPEIGWPVRRRAD